MRTSILMRERTEHSTERPSRMIRERSGQLQAKILHFKDRQLE